MNANPAVEQHKTIDRLQGSGSTGNDIDVIDLFRQDRERKLQKNKDLVEEPSAGGGAGAKASSPISIEHERKRKADPRLRAMEHFAAKAGRALPELNAGWGAGASAAEGLGALMIQASGSGKLLPAFDLI